MASSGVALLVAGLVLFVATRLRLRRSARAGDAFASNSIQRSPRGGVSTPSRLVIGLAALISGYHLLFAALDLPGLRGPLEIILPAAAAAVVATLATDRLAPAPESKSERESP